MSDVIVMQRHNRVNQLFYSTLTVKAKYSSTIYLIVTSSVSNFGDNVFVKITRESFTISIPNYGNGKCRKVFSETFSDKYANLITRVEGEIYVDDVPEIFINNKEISFTETGTLDGLGQGPGGTTRRIYKVNSSLNLIDSDLVIVINVIDYQNYTTCGLFGGKLTFYYN